MARLVGKEHPPAGDGQEPVLAMRPDGKSSINIYWRGMRIPRRSWALQCPNVCLDCKLQGIGSSGKCPLGRQR